MTVPRTVDVVVLSPLDRVFTYAVPDAMDMPCLGALVLVPFGRRNVYGVVWHHGTTHRDVSLKPIVGVMDGPILSDVFRGFLEWVWSYTVSPRGQVLRLAFPMAAAYDPGLVSKKKRKMGPLHIPNPDHGVRSFSPEQQSAIDVLHHNAAGGFSATLLDGVTGSGKTEVYCEAIAACLRMGKQCLVLLPEIALSHQIVARIAHRFGVDPHLWHSGLTPARRRDTLIHIASGDPLIVVGARSALFLPYPSLGLIVVDEEHDGSYKQEEGIRYHGRDVAVMRGFQEKIPVVLASATPSLESHYNGEIGKYQTLRLHDRHKNAQLPTIHLIDRRGARRGAPLSKWCDGVLIEKITETYGAGDQVLLYLNRRGYAPMTLCSDCGARLECANCSTYLVEHKKMGRFSCHQCGYHRAATLDCAACHGIGTLVPCGPGVERLSEDITRIFPDARQLILSSDTLSSQKAAAAAMAAIHNRDVDILIGTQIMSKGHHFPHITLVGVIDGDLGLSGGDLRAAEKTYQLLHQVSGRCGRGDKPGSVYVQTFCPDHPVMAALASGDRDAFYAQEKERRMMMDMPPFGSLAALIVSSSDQQQAERFARTLAAGRPILSDVTVWGPAPAPLFVVRGQYRFRLLLKTTQKGLLPRYLGFWLKSLKIPNAISLAIDMDPYSFL